MAGKLQDIIIKLYDLTTSITRQGFGLPLLYSLVSDYDYAEYGSLSAITESTNPVYDADIIAMATAVFKQEPVIEKVAIYGVNNTVDNGKGTATAGAAGTITLASTAAADDAFNANLIYIYAGTGKGQWRTISDYEAVTNVATVSSNWDTNPDETSKYAIFNVSTIEEAITADFTALSVQGNTGWYWLLSNARKSTAATSDMLKALSTVATTYNKIFVTEFVGTTAKTDSVAYATAMDSDRVIALTSDKSGALLDCATVGRMATYKPASATMKFKQLKAETATGYTDGEVATLHTGKVNTYVKKFGVAQLSEGLTTSSKKVFMDIRVLKDYISARISENIGIKLLNTDKIPMDANGIRTIGSVLNTTFAQFADEGLIAIDESKKPLYTITLPKYSSLDIVDKADRILKGIQFNATLAGAIHKVEITGYLEL